MIDSLRRFTAVALAEVDTSGLLLDANAGFLRLLAAGGEPTPGMQVAPCFLLPSFARLIELSRSQAQPFYEGPVTIGEITGKTRALRGSVSRTERGLSFLLEHDVEDLERACEETIAITSELAEAQHLAQVGSWNWDILGNTIVWSDEHHRIFGLKPQAIEMTYERFLSLVHPDDRSLVQWNVEQAFQNHQPYECCLRALHEDGTVRVVLSRAQVLFDGDGKPVRMFGTVQDITERKRAEDALEESERRSRAVFENSLEAILLMNDSGRYVDANAAACRLLGYSRDELLQKTVWDLTLPGEQRRIRELLSLFLDNGTLSGEYSLVCKSGELREVEYRSVANIVPGLHLGVHRDVTERKNADAALRQNERRFRLMAESIGEVFWMAGPGSQTNYYVNPVFEQIWGRSRAELRAHPTLWCDAIVSEDRPAVLSAVESLAAGTAYNLEYRIIRPDGSLRWIHDRGYAVLESEGRVEFTSGVASDITERKRAEGEIRSLNVSLERRVAKRTAELESMLANATIGLAFFDREVRFIRINRCLADLNGIPVEAHLGRSLRELLPEFAEWVEPIVHRVFDTGLPVASLQVEGLTPTLPLERRSWLESFYPVLDADGTVISVGVTVTDITDLKRAEEELAAANAKLARAARLKDEFLASMSHELRTPLNGILSLTQCLSERIYGTINSRQEEALHDVEACGRHLLSLINDILDVAKVEAGKIEAEPAPIAVDLFCQATIRLVRESAQKKRHRLSLKVDQSVDILISDERRLKQILVNLLSNAVKFTPEGGEVALEVVGDRAGRQVCFTVRDTGIGISSEDLTRLFQPFVQLDSRLSRNYPGTGLGLALVKGLTTLLGGDTRVESQPGLGSCFKVVLPWIKESGGTERVRTLPDEPGGHGPAVESPTDPLVVLFEDNSLNAKGLCEYLRFKGFRVEWASNALDGIALTQRLEPSLVLMDIQMQRMDGFEAIQRIRQLPAIGDVPIVALTALVMAGDRERCLEAGATDYIAKPVNLEELFRLVSKLTAGNSPGEPA